MTDALIPAPEAEPRNCRCGRPVPVGPLVGGWGSGCAVKHGLVQRASPRIRAPIPGTPADDEPNLLDLIHADEGENPMPPQIESEPLSTPTPNPTTPAERSGLHGVRRSGERPVGSRCRPDCRAPSPAQAHCSVCHASFGGVTNFDRHRDNGWCVDPSTLGMVERDGVWRSPMPEDVAERLRAGRVAA